MAISLINENAQQELVEKLIVCIQRKAQYDLEEEKENKEAVRSGF